MVKANYSQQGGKRRLFDIILHKVLADLHLRYIQDGGGDTHSTSTASKAVGQVYGTAKKATLVAVKMKDQSMAEIGDIFRTVLEHIKLNEREKKSIVVLPRSSSFGAKADPNDLYMAQEEQRDDIKRLMENGVIVVAAACNHALERDSDGNLRPNIDTTPGIFEGPDYPIIMVGSTDNTGEPASWSQGGDHLTIYAPGVDITSRHKILSRPNIDSGTSFCKFIHHPRTMFHNRLAPNRLLCSQLTIIQQVH